MGLKASEDYLKMLLNLNRNGSIPDTRVLLTDSPNREPESCEFDECINFALTRRPDLRKARVGIAMAKIGLDVAKDQLKPKLDLSAAIALTGMGPNYGDNWEGLGRTDYYSFSLGFDLELPLGNRSARASVKKAEYDMQRSKVGVLAAEQGVILQVRNAIRQVRTNFRRIQSAEVSAQLAERSLREEEARYRVGRSTPIEVLRFQTDLIAARNALLQAVIDYNISISALNEARGSSLLERRINLDELMEPGISVPEWNGASTGRMVPAGE
jgi:outer membrane protein TolC